MSWGTTADSKDTAGDTEDMGVTNVGSAGVMTAGTAATGMTGMTTVTDEGTGAIVGAVSSGG